MLGRNKTVVLAFAIAMLSGLLLANVASAASSGNGKGNGKSKHDDVLSYWTAERVAGAKARDIVLEGRPGDIAEKAKPGGNDGGGTSGAVNGASWNGGGAVVKTTGRVLFTLGTNNYVCSGSVVNDGEIAGKAIVVTAGHCLWDDVIGYATNWAFVSNYDAVGTFAGCETETNSCWVADELIAPAEWRAAGDNYDNDFGFAVFNTGNSTGQFLDDAVGGGQLISFNESIQRDIFAFGYPSAGKYNGSDLVYCSGRDGADPNGGTPRGIDCKMTPGSSGGPWMVDFIQSNGTGRINGVTSYSYRSLKGVLFGPVFGPVAESTYNAAIN
ncbi:MAG: peptidase [Chloroflexi bacterium]|nr:peptidase [Chloroflexota bacterium]